MNNVYTLLTKPQTCHNHLQMDSLKSNRGEEDGFLTNFVRGEIERPPDGLNGDCVIHYVGKCDGHEMRARLVNGKREGKATIFNKGVLFMILNYKDGRLNGEIKKLNQYGGIQMKGTLVNGEKNGLFKEYSDEVLTWMGYYRKGERYSVLRKSIHMNGYYEERSVKSNELLSIAEYDPELNEKNGYCIECNNGKLQEWMYEGGVKKPMIPDIDNGIVIPLKGTEKTSRKRDRPEEQSNDTPKRIRLSPSLPEHKDDSFIIHDYNTGFEYGVIRLKNRCYEVRRSEYEKQVIEVDLNSHEIREYKNGEWTECTKEEGCIDLDSNGKRWEGGLRNGKPFGYGVLYDEEGKKEYEGFMMNDARACYGKEYYKDTERFEYEGLYYNGKRFGKGVLYDRNGVVEYDGLWMSDKPYSPESNDEAVSNHSECLNIQDDTRKKDNSFFLSPWLGALKRITIGDKCYQYVQSFVIDGLNSLESIEISYDSFVRWDPQDDYKGSHQNNSFCRIVNCRNLKTICFKGFAFHYCSEFVVDNLPSLQSIQMGEECFLSSPVFSLTSRINSCFVSD